MDAFLAASRDGDFEALLAVLDPAVVLHADTGKTPTTTVNGAPAVARQAARFARLARLARPAVVNGGAGLLVSTGSRSIAVLGFTVRAGRIIEVHVLADTERLRRLDLTTAATTRRARPSGPR